MRTFHIGGTASRSVEQNKWEANFSGVLRYDDLKEVKNREGNIVILGRRGEAVIVEGDKTIKPKSKNRSRDNLEINVSNLNEGVYILEIVSDKEVDKVKILIVR